MPAAQLRLDQADKQTNPGGKSCDVKIKVILRGKNVNLWKKQRGNWKLEQYKRFITNSAIQ